MRFLWGLIMVLAFVGIAIGLLVGGVILGLASLAEAARPVFQIFDFIGFGVQALLLVVAAAFTLWIVLKTRTIVGALAWLAASVYAYTIGWQLVTVFVEMGLVVGATQTVLAVLAYGVVLVIAAGADAAREQRIAKRAAKKSV